VDFVLGRPASFMATDEFVDDGAKLQPTRWGAGQPVLPSEDLLEMADRVDTDPRGVLHELKDLRFKERPSVDRIFAKYLQAVARFQAGDQNSETLNLMREAYSDAQKSSLPEAARTEMARNLVRVMRVTERDWERDPLLNDPLVQSALVEEVQ
jgi:hypothetical protein